MISSPISEEEIERNRIRLLLPHGWMMEDVLVEYRGESEYGADVHVFIGHRPSVELNEFNLGFGHNPIRDVLDFLLNEGKIRVGSISVWDGEKWVGRPNNFQQVELETEEEE